MNDCVRAPAGDVSFLAARMVGLRPYARATPATGAHRRAGALIMPNIVRHLDPNAGPEAAYVESTMEAVLKS